MRQSTSCALWSLGTLIIATFCFVSERKGLAAYNYVVSACFAACYVTNRQSERLGHLHIKKKQGPK